jgi:hypothetical protein
MKKYAQEEQAILKEQSLMSKQQYWTEKVHDLDSAMKYYEIYHPQFPKALAHALAMQMTKKAQQLAAGEEIEEKFLTKIVKTDNFERWDYKSELQKNGIRV